jgi:hypothetical protein
MSLRVYICPCCDRPAQRRAEPLTEKDCLLSYAKMLAKGWTSDRLLAERSEDLDYIAPGLTDWLRQYGLPGARSQRLN